MKNDTTNNLSNFSYTSKKSGEQKNASFNKIISIIGSKGSGKGLSINFVTGNEFKSLLWSSNNI